MRQACQDFRLTPRLTTLRAPSRSGVSPISRFIAEQVELRRLHYVRPKVPQKGGAKNVATAHRMWLHAVSGASDMSQTPKSQTHAAIPAGDQVDTAHRVMLRLPSSRLARFFTAVCSTTETPNVRTLASGES